MTREESRLVEIVARIIDVRRSQVRINPSWIATEALRELDPSRRSVELVCLGCHLQLRQIARAQCRKLFEDDEEDADIGQRELFTGLQWRYPAAHSKDKNEPEYVLREHMTDVDIGYNVARLRAEAEAKQKHADALEAWGRTRHVA